jgi:hypothetical protein
VPELIIGQQEQQQAERLNGHQVCDLQLHRLCETHSRLAASTLHGSPDSPPVPGGVSSTILQSPAHTPGGVTLPPALLLSLRAAGTASQLAGCWP